jgi:uncharacterized protein YndB with AHSA1/START domain
MREKFMTVSPKSVITPDNDVVVAEIQVAAPPERVFQALTDERELSRWFKNESCPTKLWRMEACVGGAYRYETEQGTAAVSGVDEFECHGEILQFDPPRLLVYTWFGNWHENKSLRTAVRWELTPHDGGTHVKVTHSGLAAEAAARKDFGGGWPGVLAQLKKFTET